MAIFRRYKWMQYGLIVLLLSGGTLLALDKWYWTGFRIGSVKDSGSFTASASLGLSNITTDIYSNTRSVAGEVGIGDVVYDDAAGTHPLNGGSTWWAFIITDGASGNVRGYKINGSGVIIDVTIAGGHFAAFAYNSTTHTSNCANTTFTEAVYAADDDPFMYSNKKIFSSTGGGIVSDGSYTASYQLSGIATWTYSTSASATKVESLACCISNPIANAGVDEVADLGDASVPLSGSGFDCDGTISTYSWSRISGPNTPTITNSSLAITTITGFITGTYVYRLTVTDNASNTGTDDVTITVYPAYLGTTISKIQMLPRQVWTFNGDNTRGAIGFIGDTSNAAIATAGHKNGAWLGEAFTWVDMDFDPRNGKFDADSSRAGFQNDTTYPYIQRDFSTPYYIGGNGTQRLMLVDLGKTYYFHDVYWLDSGATALTGVAQLIVGSLEDVRKGIFEFDNHLAFGSPTIDYTFDESATKGWKHFDYLRDSGQFILIRLNDVAGQGAIAHSGPGFADFVFDGQASPFPTSKDTRITPDYSATLTRDTTLRREGNAGFVAATGWQSQMIKDTIFNATASHPSFNWQGGYLHSFASGGSPTNGVIDRNNASWHGRAASPNKVNLNPYNPCSSCTPGLWFDSSLFSRSNISNYTVEVTPNAYLLSQTSYGNNEYVPVDSSTADFRQDSSYDRYSETFILLAAKLCGEVPNFTQGYGLYINNSRYESDDFPGRYAWGRVQALIPYNECNIGFRNGSIANSNYMNPFALRAFHDKLYREWHQVFTGPFYGQGIAAWKARSFLQAQMLNNIRYMDKAHPLCDIVNIHVVCETDMVRTTEPGVVDALYARAEFGGWRDERMKAQGFLDTLAYLNGGNYKDAIFSEIAISTNRNYRVRTDPGGSDASVSTHGARPIYSSVDGHKYSVYESQGFLMTNIWAHMDAVAGIKARVHYEFADAADSAIGGCFGGADCYDNSDANDGVFNGFTAHYTRFFKGSYFITQEDQIWKARYRVKAVQSDSISGQLRYLYQNVYSQDSFLLFVQWQDSTKPANDRTFLLGNDVSTCSNKTPSWPDWTFAGTIEATTVTGGFVTIRPKPEGNYIFFKSQAVANDNYFLARMPKIKQ